MTTWVKRLDLGYSQMDILCVQLDEERLLFIQADGKYEIEPAQHGMPSEQCWHKFES